MPVITLSSGEQFETQAGETLLAASERAGKGIAYSCRNGRCSACRCRVLGGDSIALYPESGLSEQERGQGWILGCVRAPHGDMAIEPATPAGLALPPRQTLPCRIHRLQALAPDVLQVTLRLPPSSTFRFLPGQHIEVIGQGGVRRSYSLANASAAEHLLELHVREVPCGEMSRYWFGQAREGDLLRLNGPLGTNFLRDIVGKELVFLATGTGIAPVKSMLAGLQGTPVQERPNSVVLYWGGRTPADLYWDASEAAMLDRFVPVLSNPPAAWRGARGHVQQVQLAECAGLSNTVVYACGSERMIHSAKEALLAAGLPPTRFLADAFVCSATHD